MFLGRVSGPVGTLDLLKDFIRQNKGRKVKGAMEPIENSLHVGTDRNHEAIDPRTGEPRTTWPKHDKLVDDRFDLPSCL